MGEVVGPSCSRQHAVREPGKKNAQAAQARRPARRRGLPKGPGVVVVLVMVVVVRGLLVGRCWSWSCSLLVVAWSAHVGPRPVGGGAQGELDSGGGRCGEVEGIELN